MKFFCIDGFSGGDLGCVWFFSGGITACEMEI